MQASLPILRAVAGPVLSAEARAGSSGPDTQPFLRALLAGPWLPLGLLITVFLALGPWVDVPLNDDWQYARAAKLLAETGKLTIDTPIAPSIVVQSYLGAGAIGLFGFSHIVLRLLTLVLASVGLVCIERTLRLVRVPTIWVLSACALLVINPIALHATITFMTEWYGFVFALLAVYLWFFVRTRRGDDEALPAWLYLATAALAVVSFWSRQFTVLVYPALLASRFLPCWRAGFRSRLRELAGAIAGCALVAAGVLGYFAWARATGNYKPEFAKPVGALTTFSAKLWLVQFSACLAYMTASFAPILLLAHVRAAHVTRWRVGAACLAFMIGGFLALQVVGGDGYVPDRPLNARFPYVNNIVYATGVGPVTLTDVYVQRVGARPSWSNDNTWLYIEYAILLSTVLWGALVTQSTPLSRARTRDKSDRAGARTELASFGAAWLFGSQALSIQAYQGDVFDRYYFPCIISLALLIPALLTNAQKHEPPRVGLRALSAVAVFWALAWFSVAGSHDYLRWNQTRKELYEQARALGVSPSSIDAGYELNGWYNFAQSYPATCIHACRCDPWSWYCADNSYRVLMGGVPAGYRALDSVKPAYWLADGPALTLVQRQ